MSLIAYNTGPPCRDPRIGDKPEMERMNPQELAICHCIISHPAKAKFLVIQHADRWAPPFVRLPADGPMALKAKRITDAVREAYGLRTSALRQWLSTSNWHCVELELASQAAARRLKAVWVGREEYARFRNPAMKDADPFEAWLRQREAGDAVPLRPWERLGWLRRASDWMLHELDRHSIQATGSVEQHTAFRHASSVLRVPTADGDYYLKAGLPQPPHEAPLTMALAEHWSDRVPKPLTIDAAENWMLSRDYRAAGAELEFADYPAVAGSLAALQVASVKDLDRWRALGCPQVGAAELQAFAAQPDLLDGVLGEGRGIALNETELARLRARAADWAGRCRALADLGVPDALVHTDLWYANLQKRPEGYWITDWSGAVVGQPFFALLKLLRYRALWQPGQPALPAAAAGSDPLADAVVTSYLQPFSDFQDEERLREGLAQARGLEGAWRLLKWKRALDFEAPDSFGYQRVARKLQQIAREVIG